MDRSQRRTDLDIDGFASDEDKTKSEGLLSDEEFLTSMEMKHE